MALYVVTEVRWDNNRGEVQQVRWARADGARNEFIEDPYVVEVDRVVQAFDQGDTVVMRFRTGGGWVSGTRLRRKALAGGHESVEEEVVENGRT
jgi:hypothetical protein